MCNTFFLIYAWFLSIRVCVCMQNFLLLHIAQNHSGIWIRETSGKWSDFECISLELEIERLLKTTVVIKRGAISCEVIRQIQNSLLCEVIVRKCHRCHVVFKVLQFVTHFSHKAVYYDIFLWFPSQLVVTLAMCLLSAIFDLLSSRHVTSLRFI